MGKLKINVITSVHIKSFTKGDDKERKLLVKKLDENEGLMQEVVLVS